MSKITLKGNAINTNGVLPAIGSIAADFKLIAGDLSVKTLGDFKGKNLVLNIFPSIDTGTCAASVRNFNKMAADLLNTTVLCVSRDLPFAQNRFCGAEGIENVIVLSDFNTGQFGKDYGLEIVDGPLAGLHSRCIVVLNGEGKVVYTEQVAETSEEPNYDLALALV
ncbi:thiol peroxidase [Crocinitomicaceae bacterium]|mgnify:FL=1|nr:thiol peroxidase [Crocinitomicaceae bacterium]MDC0100448.1 thiol peroxidase [Crocinitomicaceae bacterium]MDC1196177.1 thiol peroxidase [Crocinitomicaceae bacterium]|tara:strand:+ start:712 stop:1209 length:498 start_codon:yes stop_codon:yes gene_type:complete